MTAGLSRTRSWTYLYEIVYPENRIVLNYRGLHDLILLGAVDIPFRCDSHSGGSVRGLVVESGNF